MSQDLEWQPHVPPLAGTESESAAAHPAAGASGCRTFSVWAPLASRAVDLKLNGTRHAMDAVGRGWWLSLIRI